MSINKNKELVLDPSATPPAEVKKKKNGRQGEGGGNKTMVLTDEQKSTLKNILCFVDQQTAADFIKISLTTLKKIIKNDPEVGDYYKDGAGYKKALISNTLMNAVMNGNISAAMFLAKTQFPDTFSERQTIEHVSGFKAVIVNDLGPTTDDG